MVKLRRQTATSPDHLLDVNKNAGKELAREMKKNAKKKGIDLKVDERELQKIIEKAFK